MCVLVEYQEISKHGLKIEIISLSVGMSRLKRIAFLQIQKQDDNGILKDRGKHYNVIINLYEKLKEGVENEEVSGLNIQFIQLRREEEIMEENFKTFEVCRQAEM